jgi:hypothetical protein
MKDKTTIFRGQSTQHQLDSTNLEHAFTCLWQLFIVSTVAAITPQPSKSPLNYPTPFDNFKILTFPLLVVSNFSQLFPK